VDTKEVNGSTNERKVSLASEESEPESLPTSPNCSKHRPEVTRFKLVRHQMYRIELKDVHSLRLFFDSDARSSVVKQSKENDSGVGVESDLDNLTLNRSNCTDDSSSLNVSDSIQSNEKLVIGSTRSRFKILHFHNGGLDRLADVLNEWKFLIERKTDRRRFCSALSDQLSTAQASSSTKEAEADGRFLYYCVNPPQLAYADCHPNEHQYSPMRTMQGEYDDEGDLIDWRTIRQRIFFAGLDVRLRAELWPFLLQRFPVPSVAQQRAQLKQQARMLYDQVDQGRRAMSDVNQSTFYRRFGSTIEKDVPRTDRKNVTLRSEHNTQILERVLLNFAFHCPEIGYTQGMSDLLAPLVLTIDDESEVFACFVQLMRRKQFVCQPNDQSMDRCIATIRELLRVFAPRSYLFYVQPTVRDLLFTHRWMLLCFRREFAKSAAMTIWQCCWAEVQTPCFQYFVCVAAILMYGEDAVNRHLSSDDVLLYFALLSKQMDAELVLKRARGLLHKLLSLPSIPCSLLHVLDSKEPLPPTHCIKHSNVLDSHLCPCPQFSDC
jgi:hypothetical protein